MVRAPLYLDLDGTILDVWRRHYAAYFGIVQALGEAPIGFGDYRAWKRSGRRVQEHPSARGMIRTEFARRWLEIIEAPALLELDIVQPEAVESLEKLRSDGYPLRLMTLRRNREGLLLQLERLGIRCYFSDVVSPGGVGPAATDKTALVQDLLARDGRAIVVGDTEADVTTARVLGLICVCVTGGLRDRSFLQALEPDVLISSLGELAAALDALARRRETFAGGSGAEPGISWRTGSPRRAS